MNHNMSYELSEKLKKLTPYNPVSGDYKIRMDANESFVTPYQEYSDLINLAVSQVALKRYPDPYAKRTCEFFARYYGTDPEYVTAGNGSDELISVICNAFTDQGSKAMVLDPDFSMYKFYLTLNNCEIITFNKNEDFTIDTDRLIRECNSNGCGLLIFSNPCNPTSLGLVREQVIKIITSVNALVVLDEAYMDFWDQSLITQIHEYDNVIMLRTCSKMMGLAALRVGFAIANEQLTTVIRAAKSPYNVNSYSQAAVSAMLAHPEMIKEARRKLLIGRNELYLLLKDMAQSKNITVYPTCTNFVTVAMDNAAEVSECLKRESIIVRDFDGYLRITTGKKAENRALFEALLKICK